MSTLRGQAFNIGGGPANTISLLELLDMIEQLNGRRTQVQFSAWRPGDQRYYVSDPTKMQQMTGWSPRVTAQVGVRRLHHWLSENVIGRKPQRRLPSSISAPGDSAWTDTVLSPDVQAVEAIKEVTQ